MTPLELRRRRRARTSRDLWRQQTSPDSRLGIAHEKYIALMATTAYSQFNQEKEMNMATHVALSDEQKTEAAIVTAGKTAPRITPADIDAAITSEHYFTAADGVAGENPVSQGDESRPWLALGLLTFCVLVLRNGFTVTGESACASPENFDPQIGRDIARKNAREKIWPLAGYLLKQRLFDAV